MIIYELSSSVLSITLSMDVARYYSSSQLPNPTCNIMDVDGWLLGASAVELILLTSKCSSPFFVEIQVISEHEM